MRAVPSGTAAPCITSWTLFFAMLCPSWGAAAQPPRAGRFMLEGDVSFYHRHEGTTALTALAPTLRGAARVLPWLGVEGGATFVRLRGHALGRSVDAWAVGSVHGGVEATFDRDAHEGSARFSLATSPHHDDALDGRTLRRRIALETAFASRGSWDVWRWTRNAVSLALEGRYSWRRREIRLHADVAGALIVHTRDRIPWAVFQAGVEAAYEGSALGAGTRIRTAVVGHWHYDPQFSAEPFVDVALSRVRVEAALTMNLDAPSGFAFDPSVFGMWRFRLGARARF